VHKEYKKYLQLIHISILFPTMATIFPMLMLKAQGAGRRSLTTIKPGLTRPTSVIE